MWRAWKLKTFTYIQSASGQTGSRVLRYLMLCDRTESEYKEVKLWRVPKCMTTLSAKLAAACVRIMNGELERRMTQFMEDCMNKGRVIPGLVALRWICN